MNSILNIWLNFSHWIIIVIFVLVAIIVLILIILLILSRKEKDASVQENSSSFKRSMTITGIVAGIIVIILLAGGLSVTIKEIYNIAGIPELPYIVTNQNSGKIYYLGILPLEKPTTMLERFAGVKKFLREETGLNIELKLYQTTGEVGGYTSVVRDVANGDIDFAYLASVTTVQANGNGPVIPFACAEKNGSPTYQGDLVVKVNSSYQSLADLQGKKVSGTSKSSASGNLMPSAMLKQEGIDKETYFDGGMIYLGSHDKAAEAVLAGTIDGAFINETTLNKYNKDGIVLRSIWRHNPVPEFPFVVNTEVVSQEVLNKIKDALLRMHETNLAGIQACDTKYEKWVAIDWEDYLGIKTAIDEVYGPVFYDLEEWGN